jgi:hypothetical protein
MKEGDRVYTYDLDNSKCFGTIHKNKEYPNVSEWYVKYDDGQECAVLDLSLIIKTKQHDKRLNG